MSLLTGISGAFIRGSLDTATEGLRAPAENLEKQLEGLGQKYNSLAPEAEKQIAAAQKNNANINRIADDLNLAPGIVASIYESTGGDETKTRTQLDTILDAYNNKIPVVNIEDPKIDKLKVKKDQKVKEPTEKNILSDFASLFKNYGTDEVLEIFAKKQNISVDKARAVLSGTFGELLPKTSYKVKPSADAMRRALKGPPKSFLDDKVVAERLKILQRNVGEVVKNQDKYSQADVNLAFTLEEKFLKSGNDETARNMAYGLSTLIRKIPTIELTESQKDLLDNVKGLINTAVTSVTVGYNAQELEKLTQLVFTTGDINFEALNTQYMATAKTKDKIVEEKTGLDNVYLNEQYKILDSNVQRILNNQDKYSIATIKSVQPLRDNFLKAANDGVFEEKGGDDKLKAIMSVVNNIEQLPDNSIPENLKTLIPQARSIITTYATSTTVKYNKDKINALQSALMSDIKDANYYTNLNTKLQDVIGTKSIIKTEKGAFDTGTPTGLQFKNIESIVTRIQNNSDKFSKEAKDFASSAIRRARELIDAEELNKVDVLEQKLETFKITEINKKEIPLEWSSTNTNVNTLTSKIIGEEKVIFNKALVFELMDLQRAAIVSGEDNDWKKVQSKYAELLSKKIIKTVDKEVTVPAEFKLIQKTVEDITNSFFTKKDSGYDKESVLELSALLYKAQQGVNNNNLWEDVRNKLGTMQPSFLAPEAQLSAADQVKAKAALKKIIASPYYINEMTQISTLPEDQQAAAAQNLFDNMQQKANEIAVSNVFNFKGGIYTDDFVVTKDGTVVKTVTQVPIVKGNAGSVSGGIKSLLPEDEAVKNDKLLDANFEGLKDIEFLYAVLKKDKTAYSFIGEFRKKGGNIADIVAGMAGGSIDIGQGDLQDAEQRMTSFVSNVKGKLFDDPRLSDQDLKLVLNYIGVINASSQGGVGLGSVAARRALAGIERVFSTAMAVGLAKKTPNKSILVYAKGGGISLVEDSVARDLIDKKLQATGFIQGKGILTKDEVLNLSDERKEQYKDILATTMVSVRDAVMGAQAFRNDEKNYKDNYKTKGLELVALDFGNRKGEIIYEPRNDKNT